MWTGVVDRTQEQTLVFHCLEKGTHLTLQEGRGHKDHLTFGRWWGHAVLVVGTANIGDGCPSLIITWTNQKTTYRLQCRTDTKYPAKITT